MSRRPVDKKAFMDFLKSMDELPKGENLLQIAHLLSESTMLIGNGTDYFIETSELTDLILGMVRDFTADIIDVFVETRNTAFVIHPQSQKPAVLVGVHQNPVGTIVTFCESKGKLTNWDPTSFVKKDRIQANCYAEKLAVGLALYMRFFPEAVKIGIPESAKHPTHYKGKKCATIGLTEKLVDRTGSKPHIRQSHFRFLGSERFTKKKGTYVLVKGAFIRGKCKIVVEVET